MHKILSVMALVTAAGGCAPGDPQAAANDSSLAESAPASAVVDAGPPLAIAASDPALKWGPCPPVFAVPGCMIAVLHGDPAKPNADLMLRVPGGYEIPPHRHTSAERMVLVSGSMRVHYQGHPEVTVAAGNYAFGPPGLPHEAVCVSAEPCTLFIAFEGPVDAEAVAGQID